MVDGYEQKRAVELWDIRQISYPLWYANAKKEDIVPITEYMPIPRLDKKDRSIKNKRWTPEEIKKVFGEYYEA